MSILTDISENLQRGKAKIVKELVQQAIDEGIPVQQILDEGLLSGMGVIGEKFKNNEVFVPEVLVAARAMNMGAQLLKPLMADAGVEAAGKVCIGTVKGDLHDIGKNLVKMMMEGKGLEVVDLGTDVAPETYVQTAVEQGCQIICCSALLTTTMGMMEEVVKKAEEAGIRDKVKIMVGGAPVTEAFCEQIGADKYTADAASAADASQSATAARQSAEAAAGSEDRAARSAASILGLQVEVSTLDPGLPAGGDYDPETGILHLGIPKGDSGASAIATPTSLGSVMPQTGHEDGLELETDGKLRVRKASASQRGGVLASTTAAANTVPQAGEDGTLDASWVPRPDCWDMFPPFVPVPIWGATPGGSDGRRAIMPGEEQAREEWILCDGGSDGKDGTVPDLRGRYVRGASEAEPEGTEGGSEDVAVDLSGSTGATTLNTTQMPSHTHPFSAVISTKGRYMESGNLYNSGSSNTSATGGNGSHTHPLSGSVSGTHTDPHLAMNYFIKVV